MGTTYILRKDYEIPLLLLPPSTDLVDSNYATVSETALCLTELRKLLLKPGLVKRWCSPSLGCLVSFRGVSPIELRRRPFWIFIKKLALRDVVGKGLRSQVVATDLVIDTKPGSEDALYRTVVTICLQCQFVSQVGLDHCKNN